MTDEASRLRQSHFGSGFDAGKRARDAEVERLKRELHRARISLAVTIGFLPSELLDACAAETDRQLEGLDHA